MSADEAAFPDVLHALFVHGFNLFAEVVFASCLPERHKRNEGILKYKNRRRRSWSLLSRQLRVDIESALIGCLGSKGMAYPPVIAPGDFGEF